MRVTPPMRASNSCSSISARGEKSVRQYISSTVRNVTPVRLWPLQRVHVLGLGKITVMVRKMVVLERRQCLNSVTEFATRILGLIINIFRATSGIPQFDAFFLAILILSFTDFDRVSENN